MADETPTDDGDPIAYTALVEGVPMLTSSGTRFGAVGRVLQIPEEDLFDGIIVRTEQGERFVDADQVASITELAVHCRIADDEVESLPAPAGTPVFDAAGDDDVGPGVGDWVRRHLTHGKWHEEK